MDKKSTPGLCECGCGNPTTRISENNSYLGLVAGQYRKFIHGHNTRTMPGIKKWLDEIRPIEISAKGRSRMSKAQKVAANNPERIKKIRATRARNGTSIISPFLPNTSVNYQKIHKRWYCVSPDTGTAMTHARAVYIHFFGAVPEGEHIHHKNGDASKLELDSPDNLISVPAMWNFWFFPSLAVGFGVPESEVTKAYIDLVGKVPSQKLFSAVCRKLSEDIQ